MIHVRDFPVTSRRLTRNLSRLTGKFRGSQRNGIWAFATVEFVVVMKRRRRDVCRCLRVSDDQNHHRDESMTSMDRVPPTSSHHHHRHQQQQQRRHHVTVNGRDYEHVWSQQNSTSSQHDNNSS